MVTESGKAPRFVPAGSSRAEGQDTIRLLDSEEEYWDGIFGISGVGGPVSTAAVSGSTLYACGDFVGSVGMPLNGIAKWDGTTWSPLGSGIDGGITALAVIGSNLYVGGHFLEAGGVSSANIALWHFNPQSRKDDLLGTWDGQGVYYRDSVTGLWVKMASPATLITTGDIDGDATDDLIGIWPTQGGVWVKYSSDGTWERLSSTAQDITAGKMRAASTLAPPESAGGQVTVRAEFELPLPMGGFAEGPAGALNVRDLSRSGPGGARFVFKQEKNLNPVEGRAEQMSRMLKPGPGEPGFRSVHQENLVPGVTEDRETKKITRKR
jgi:hypothetical protein